MRSKRECQHELNDGHTDGDNDGATCQPAAKRHQFAVIRNNDLIFRLSDDLLLLIASFLDEKGMLKLSLVSKRFNRITSDSWLWQLHYFYRFILPRAGSIPGFLVSSTISQQRHPSGYACAHGNLRQREVSVEKLEATTLTSNIVEAVDWEKQYKLRLHWDRIRYIADEARFDNKESNNKQPTQWQPVAKLVSRMVNA